MAFQEFANQVWAASDTSVTITNNTDSSLDGSSRILTWTDAVDEYVTVTFNSVTLSDYEEISLWLYLQDTLSTDNLFTVTVGGDTFTFSRSDFLRNRWNHILFDCSDMSAATTMRITSLVDDLVLAIDYIGYRSTGYDMDIDVIEALKDYINLDYDVETTLSSAVTAGDTEIEITSNDYVTDTSILEIDDGAGTIEEVELLSRPSSTEPGNLATAITNSFPVSSTVRVLCPVRSEDYDSLEPDPICGIVIYDMDVERQMTTIKLKDSYKIKEFLGAIGVCIYIDCSSKKKLLKLCREFNRKYGENFVFLLDGELVDVYLETSVYNDAILGSNHRMAYYYKIEPQPYLLVNRAGITTFNFDVDSTAAEEIL